MKFDEKINRDLYLRDLALGNIQGPPVGYASIDKPWLKYYDEEAIKKELPKGSVYDIIYENNKDYLDNNAILYFNKYITYRELFDNIESVAKALKANGVREGDIVNVSLPNIPEAVYVFYAISKIGAIANMIDPRSSDRDIKHYINEVNSNMLIVVDDPSVTAKIYNIIKDTNLEKIVKVSPINSLGMEPNRAESFWKSDVEICNYSKFINEGKSYFRHTKVDYVKDRAVVIEHTGGTTGLPKGVLLTNDAINMIAHHFMISDLAFDRNQKWLNIMPTFIAYGVGNGLHLPLCVGMCVIAVPKFEPDKMDDLIAMYRPDNFAGVPIHYESIIRSKKLDDVDFSTWVLPGVGGDTMDTSLEIEANEFLRKHNAKTNVIKGYGLTEVCAAACVSFCGANEIGSVGIPFVHNNISVFEPELDNKTNTYNGRELGYNEMGEICIASPSMMLEYYKNQKETENVLKKHPDGKIWMHTGDIGYITNNGLVYIDGRTKRVIIRYDGFKIYPFGIEKLITSLPEVEACKAIATPDVDHIQGFLPQANIILKDEYKGMELEVLEKIKNLCNTGLAEYVIPAEYQIIDKFPRTPIGKVDYVAMEKINLEKVKRRVR